MSDTKSGLTTPFLMETMPMVEGRWQKEGKEFRQKGGYQGGFGMTFRSDSARRYEP